MPKYGHFIGAPSSSTDEAIVRFDGTTGNRGQNSVVTVTDAGVLTAPGDTGQLIAGTTQTGVTIATIAQVPMGYFAVDSTSIRPALFMHRGAPTSGAGGASSGPSFNFVRCRGPLGSPVAVNNNDTLGVFSGVGFDGTDYAPGATIEMRVDEADTGTAAVGSNQMGAQIRFLTARRTTQNPLFSAAMRHNGAFQLNTGMTLAPTATATGMGGAFEVDTKVPYYTHEDGKRGVIGAMYIICPTGSNTLTNGTGEQALFDDVGTGTLTLPTGTFLWGLLASFSGLESGAASNLAFDILGAGSATVAALYMSDGLENAIDTAGANTASMSSVPQSQPSILVGVANAGLQLRSWGIFRITAAGTIIPSVTLAAVSAGTPTRSANSLFYCEPIGSSTVQTVGPWS